MKKNIFGLFVCMLVVFIMLPTSGLAVNYEYKLCTTVMNDTYEIQINNYFNNGDILDQSQVLTSGLAWFLTPDQWIAQGFKPTLSIMTRVELFLHRYNDPPIDTIITVSIRDSLTGSDLTSKEIVAGDFTPNPKWVEFDFSDIQVIPEHLYYIVARSDCSMWDDAYSWACRFNNPYDRGDAWMSHDNGANWILADFPEQPKCDMCFKTYGLNQPPSSPSIKGETSGGTRTVYYYTFSAIDPEGNDVFYFVDWGDLTTTGWDGPHASGEEISLPHSWKIPGTYTIKAKAKDTLGEESDWGTLQVTMPRDKATSNVLFWRLLEQFPILQKLLYFIR